MENKKMLSRTETESLVWHIPGTDRRSERGKHRACAKIQRRGGISHWADFGLCPKRDGKPFEGSTCGG